MAGALISSALISGVVGLSLVNIRRADSRSEPN
jgi:hypothetical protein